MVSIQTGAAHTRPRLRPKSRILDVVHSEDAPLADIFIVLPKPMSILSSTVVIPGVSAPSDPEVARDPIADRLMAQQVPV